MSKALQKRAKRKYLNTPILQQLSDLDSPLKDKYLKSFYCSSKIIISESGKTQSRYCKRPWCAICNPIRVAVRLNDWTSELQQLNNLYLTTLTVPNVPANELRETLIKFTATFRQIRNTLNKRNNYKIQGVFNIEITYNKELNNYHPHLHLIHSNGLKNEISQHIQTEWLKNYPTAVHYAQDGRPCFNLIEGFKYAAYGITKKKLESGKYTFMFLPEAMDKIFIAIQALRMFQSYGIKKPIKSEKEEFEKLSSEQTNNTPGDYHWKHTDWIELCTGELLSNYQPSELQINFHTQLSKS